VRIVLQIIEVKNANESDAQASAPNCTQKNSKRVGVRTVSKMEPPLRLTPHIKPLTPLKTGGFLG
jgi:hypothetical protein